MALLIPRKARLRGLLSLKRQVEDARDLLLLSLHEVDDLEGKLRAVRKRVHEAVACFDVVVELYNHIVVEYDDPPRRRG